MAQRGICVCQHNYRWRRSSADGIRPDKSIMGNYIAVFIADLLYAIEFLFTKMYQNREQDGLTASLNFSLATMLITGVGTLCMSKFQICVTPFSLLMAFVLALVCLGLVYSSIASLRYVNLSMYSVFMMLGSMLAPFVYGIVFLHEPLTFGKILCIILIGRAMLLNINHLPSKKGATKYYFIVFFLNGATSVVGKIHQINSSDKFGNECSHGKLYVSDLYVCPHPYNSVWSAAA
uniref:EamA domain-containing protein n=1 Tax=uncultured bacterium fosmid pJB148G3 TaxID=1478052 RepID=A0A0H3U8M7_9BACT|nr:hypothetical protein [uncultured bacterium fosmid pJB148G3]